MESNFYYALGHDLRRRIIKIIGDNDFSSFTNLKEELVDVENFIKEVLDFIKIQNKKK